MNNIQQLIQQYCPEGVEYRKLGEVCEIKGRIGFRGYTRADLVEKGEGAISLSPSNIINGRINYDKCSYVSWDKYYESPEIMIENGDVIFCKTASVGKTCYVDNLPEKATINPQFVVFKNIKINHKFLSYLVSDNDFQRNIQKIKGLGSIPTLSQKDMASIDIPLPPLPIQQKIVEILDSFTSLETELEQNLEAELEARRKQYNYYRDQLLSFKDDESVEWKTLGEVGTLTRGKYFQKSDFQEEGIPCIHYGQLYTYYKTYTDKTIKFVSKEVAQKSTMIRPQSVIITLTSENIEDVCTPLAWIGNTDVAISGHAVGLETDMNPKYIAYYLQTSFFFNEKRKKARGAKVIEIKPEELAKISIPIPSLSLQSEIVSILDRFESLVNDISSGLPAEIKARHQQYEYYRDQLLTFKRKN